MNFGTPVPLLIGIVLILGAVALFFLDRLKPGYARDSDRFYALLWLVSGVISLTQLNMDFVAAFQEMLMAGMLIAVTVQNVSSRSPKEERFTAPASEGRDYYRPARPRDPRPSGPRMNVRAELDNEDPYRPRFPEDRRMLRGREEPPRRTDYYSGDAYSSSGYDDRSAYSDRSAPREDRPVERLNPSGDRLRRRRPKSVDGRYGGDLANRGWDESATGYAANSGGYSSHSPSSPSSYSKGNGRDDDSYVDYRPVNYPKDDSDNSSPDYGSRY